MGMGLVPASLEETMQGKRQIGSGENGRFLCGYDLCILYLNFGAPGAKNDKQIFQQSFPFNKMRIDVWPPKFRENEYRRTLF